MTEKRYATPNQIPKLYPGAFNLNGVRYIIVHRKENGFDSCMRRVGKKILIDLDEFEKWVDSRKPQDWK